MITNRDHVKLVPLHELIYYMPHQLDEKPGALHSEYSLLP